MKLLTVEVKSVLKFLKIFLQKLTVVYRNLQTIKCDELKVVKIIVKVLDFLKTSSKVKDSAGCKIKFWFEVVNENDEVRRNTKILHMLVIIAEIAKQIAAFLLVASVSPNVHDSSLNFNNISNEFLDELLKCRTFTTILALTNYTLINNNPFLYKQLIARGLPPAKWLSDEYFCCNHFAEFGSLENKRHDSNLDLINDFFIAFLITTKSIMCSTRICKSSGELTLSWCVGSLTNQFCEWVNQNKQWYIKMDNHYDQVNCDKVNLLTKILTKDILISLSKVKPTNSKNTNGFIFCVNVILTSNFYFKNVRNYLYRYLYENDADDIKDIVEIIKMEFYIDLHYSAEFLHQKQKRLKDTVRGIHNFQVFQQLIDDEISSMTNSKTIKDDVWRDLLKSNIIEDDATEIIVNPDAYTVKRKHMSIESSNSEVPNSKKRKIKNSKIATCKRNNN